MVNYYKSFKKFCDSQKLHGQKILLDEFESKLKIFFGFGGRNKTVNRWVGNFEDVGLIKIIKDIDGVWFVEVL